MEQRRVNVRTERFAGGTRYVDAELNNEGFAIEGQTLDDGEYEWSYRFSPEHVQPIVDALGGKPDADPIDTLQTWLIGREISELDALIKGSGIEVSFWNRIEP